MKYLFLLCLSLPCFAYAQPYVLLDRQLKRPVEVTSQLESGKIAPLYFPIYSKDLDAMIKVVDQCIDLMDAHEMEAVEENFQLGNSRMVFKKDTDHKISGYTVYLVTRAKDHGFSLELVNKEDSKLKGLRKMKWFLYYLRNNRNLVQDHQTALFQKGF